MRPWNCDISEGEVWPPSRLLHSLKWKAAWISHNIKTWDIFINKNISPHLHEWHIFCTKQYPQHQHLINAFYILLCRLLLLCVLKQFSSSLQGDKISYLRSIPSLYLIWFDLITLSFVFKLAVSCAISCRFEEPWKNEMKPLLGFINWSLS